MGDQPSLSNENHIGIERGISRSSNALIACLCP